MKVPPHDLWTPTVLSNIRNRSTLEAQITDRFGYSDVYFTSNPSADWFEASESYAEHNGDRIRIHGILAYPLITTDPGPYPALVIGHGHGGRADRTLAQLIAGFGYVVLAIDGPRAGESTGGPEDKNQAWISVDKGPQYGYLYHYAYAGMRALTLLEHLAAQPGNLYRIDPTKFGVLGASMGGILATYMNGIDDRLDTAVIIASAGNWHHTLRYPNSWLYHGIYASTRDIPYNGQDPQNSIEDIETDATAVTFVSYFDPIRYAPRQHAPVLTIIGTHDEYFPLPNANLTHLAMSSAGTQPDFEKRLWLLPNAPHQFDTSTPNLLALAAGVRQWLNYSFGKRGKPLATPVVTQAGRRFEAQINEPANRLNGVIVKLYVATRIDTTASPIQDFKEYPMLPSGGGYAAEVPAGDLEAPESAVYFVTASDLLGAEVPVSSLVSSNGRPLDLSSGLVPVIRQFPDDTVVAPVPPEPAYDQVSINGSVPVPAGAAYQGLAISNATEVPVVAKLEARTAEGRVAAAEGLSNPAFLFLPPRSQKVFVAEEWLGPGARQLEGSLQVAWSGVNGTLLSFRGNVAPSELDSIGPMVAAAGPVWIPLVPDLEASAARRLRVFAGSSAAQVDVLFRNVGGQTQSRTVEVPASGSIAVVPPAGYGLAELRSGAAFSARLEVTASKDPWSIDALHSNSAGTYVQPHVEWNGIFTTRLVVVNSSSSRRSAVLKLRERDGREAFPQQTIAVPANSVVMQTLESVFGVPTGPGGSGWLEAATEEGLEIVALASDGSRGAAAASPLQSAGPGVWSMPFFVENSGYYTGLAVANPGAGPVAVTMTAYDAAGKKLTSVTVSPGARQSVTQLVSQWMPGLEPEATGQLVIEASAPIALLAYFGTDDGASLAAIPFTPISPAP
jgi:cephalosporin-C deacetylase-like acetyl esterase